MADPRSVQHMAQHHPWQGWALAKGYRVIPVPGDGHCLYHALSHGGPWAEQEQRSLRMALSRHARLHKAALWPWDVDDLVIEGFLQDTQDDRVWGGELQAHVYAHMEKVQVRILQPLGFDTSYGEPTNGTQTLLYWGRGGAKPNHYDVLVPSPRQQGDDVVERQSTANTVTGEPYKGEDERQSPADAPKPGQSYGEGTQQDRLPRGSTTLLTVNVSGSKDAMCWALRQKVQVVLLQEHKAVPKLLGAWQACARRAGWHGVWTPALETDKQGRSGGVATLVPIGCPIFAPNGTSGPRWLHVSIPWTRSKALQVGNIYGYDVGQPDAVKCNRALHHEILQVLFLLGRTPWVIGGDWNLAPDQVALPLFAGGAAIDPGLPTVDAGSTLDWFLAGPCMRDLAISRVLTAAPIAVHRPVTLGLQAVQQMDLGKCVVVPTPLTQVVTGPHPQPCGWEL